VKIPFTEGAHDWYTFELDFEMMVFLLSPPFVPKLTPENIYGVF
jgi:hypothetical protein